MHSELVFLVQTKLLQNHSALLWPQTAFFNFGDLPSDRGHICGLKMHLDSIENFTGQ